MAAAVVEAQGAAAGDHGGFRLDAVELYNWGTFHRHVARLECAGANALLTGDIGAGKSTIVDALTTLLVPHQRIVYNRAAGAESGERRLLGYVRGAWKSSQSEAGSGRTVHLREHDEFSVLLARFRCAPLDEWATLAQVLWSVEGQSQPEKYFLVASCALSIRDLLALAADPAELRKKLRKREHVEVYAQFSDYQLAWRRQFGIGQEHALGLFYQTVSLKAIGNLTEFIRSHMLAAPALEERVRALIDGFASLDAAHAAVLKARDQLALLIPIRDDGQRLTALEAEQQALRALRDALDCWRAAQRIRLLRAEITRLENEVAAGLRKLDRLKERLAVRHVDQRELQIAIDGAGGLRLREIEREVGVCEQRQKLQVEQDKRYKALARTLSLPVRAEAESFIANQAAARQLVDQLAALSEQLQEQRQQAQAELLSAQAQERALEAEIQALAARPSNIPHALLLLREQLCAALGLNENRLPFAGELIEVRAGQRDWEAAIERVLHNFARSLLVPETHYAQVSDWVDRTHLRGQLVYFRMAPVAATQAPSRAAAGSATLTQKLALKEDSPHLAWLRQRLVADFDLVCCDTMEEFRREPRALTRLGQVKTGGGRHVKDDRHALGDRTRYVLGWSNVAKLLALRAQLLELQQLGQQAVARRAALLTEIGQRQLERDAARDLANLRDYAEIDWPGTARRLRELREEAHQLEAANDQLRALQARQLEVQTDVARLESERDRLAADSGRDQALSAQRGEELAAARELLATDVDGAHAQAFPTLDARCLAQLGGRDLNLRILDAQQSELRTQLGQEIDAGERRVRTLAERLGKRILDFRKSYEAEVGDLDHGVQAWPEYAALLTAIERDDLPRYEQRFRELLRQETIRGVALFNANLEQASRTIRDKIAEINATLAGIEYGAGTRIELMVESHPDVEVREFRRDLAACLSDTVGVDQALYSEQKFLQVKALIERFKGRPSLADSDRRWTEKVTDVRQWFVFSAVERYVETGLEREYYTDSAGKSGGQKEKLAYTILASALAFQFGAVAGAPRSFRFVMIDEAFGRGTDDSARYALDLFARMGLQLLIVTPLQKIHVIEDYVARLHFVANPDGADSRVRTIGIEQHRTQLAQRRLSAGSSSD